MSDYETGDTPEGAAGFVFSASRRYVVRGCSAVPVGVPSLPG
jgi:hypothetical protein